MQGSGCGLPGVPAAPMVHTGLWCWPSQQRGCRYIFYRLNLDGVGKGTDKGSENVMLWFQGYRYNQKF
eukprot:1065084-Amphidinium_carterae.1